MPSAAEIRELERVGYRLWVAPEVEELDGWQLRCARGLTSRGNSVFPNAGGELPVETKLGRVEAWYAERGLPPCFQLTPGSLPVGLADALEGCGYRRTKATSVQTAALPAAAADDRVELAGRPGLGWTEIWTGSRGFDDAATALALLTGSPGETAFARIADVAVGRAVACDGWLGITSMVTVPEARRRGLGRALLATLLAWGRAAGCTQALLQVEADNEPARALYERFGFRERYVYSYAVAP